MEREEEGREGLTRLRVWCSIQRHRGGTIWINQCEYQSF